MVCLSFVLLFIQIASAKNIAEDCQNFEFIRDLRKDAKGEDVLVLQKILNSDIRTQIAKSGVGSKGQETRLFGEKTRDALKRFQALFIEHTLTADGVFQGKTKELIVYMCSGSGMQTFKTSSTSAILDFFSTTSKSTITLEHTDPDFDYFLDQMPRAFQQDPKTIIEKYFRQLMYTIYPPQPIIVTPLGASTTATATQPAVPQVTVSSVLF